jgi:hypothetical protein
MTDTLIKRIEHLSVGPTVETTGWKRVSSMTVSTLRALNLKHLVGVLSEKWLTADDT